jgi:hypothetical protein
MGIKERERRVEVFFYGLFMDEELLRGKGLEPEGGEIAAIDGFALRIGQRAALVPTPGAKVYGLVFSLTRGACACNDDKVIFENPLIYSAGDVLELLFAGRCVH